MGYGDVLPVERGRRLGLLAAMNSVLPFGWSTAAIFEVLRHAMRSRDQRPITSVPLDGARVLRDAKDPFHAADYAACHTTYCPADSSANRTGGAIAHSCSLLGATNNALSMNTCRHRQNGQPEGSGQSVSFHRSHSSMVLGETKPKAQRNFPARP